MTPALVLDYLPTGNSIAVLDPMSGSGTTLVTARAKGHYAIGCDTDPLALLIARAWCSDVDPIRLLDLGARVLNEARALAASMLAKDAYPNNCDDKTKAFINFWFDDENRIQLAALSNILMQVNDDVIKDLLWSAFSRLIITKKSGVSLAMDVSHSRPHKKYVKAPIAPFDKFFQSVEYINKKAPFHQGYGSTPAATIKDGDARRLPVEEKSIDMIITSPPYLNAIDYLRGHKLALVWMGYSIDSLRAIRSSNIGTEHSEKIKENMELINVANEIGEIDKLNESHKGMIFRYLHDMKLVFSECRRVLKNAGELIVVIGNSSIHGIYINNSTALVALAKINGLELLSQTIRPLPDSNRYLPSPNSEKSGHDLKKRMREEAILQFVAT